MFTATEPATKVVNRVSNFWLDHTRVAKIAEVGHKKTKGFGLLEGTPARGVELFNNQITPAPAAGLLYTRIFVIINFCDSNSLTKNWEQEVARNFMNQNCGNCSRLRVVVATEGTNRSL